MNWMSGRFMGTFDLKDERLLVLNQKDLGRITLTVSPQRYYRGYLGGAQLSMVESGMLSLQLSPLPILVRAPNKPMPDGMMPYEKILSVDSGSLRRVFPSDSDLERSNQS